MIELYCLAQFNTVLASILNPTRPSLSANVCPRQAGVKIPPPKSIFPSSKVAAAWVRNAPVTNRKGFSIHRILITKTTREYIQDYMLPWYVALQHACLFAILSVSGIATARYSITSFFDCSISGPSPALYTNFLTKLLMNCDIANIYQVAAVTQCVSSCRKANCSFSCILQS